MHLSPSLLLLCLASSALAIPSPLSLVHTARTAIGWSIRSFTRNCTNPDICTYTFGIDNGVDVNPIPCTVVDYGVGEFWHFFLLSLSLSIFLS